MDGLKGGNCTSVAVHVCPSLLSQRCVSLYLVKATWSSGSETFLPLHLLAFQIFDVDGVWSQTWLISLVICFGPVTNLVVRHTLAATSFSVVQDAHLTLKLVTHRPHCACQRSTIHAKFSGPARVSCAPSTNLRHVPVVHHGTRHLECVVATSCQSPKLAWYLYYSSLSF